MVRGIMASQLGLDTTGHNISNAGTEGYSRQTVTLATTYSEQRPSLYGEVMVGTGVDALAVERARNVYADIQYRNENPSMKYYETMAVNYDKLETIFDDSKGLGVEAAINNFYQSWVDLSTTASTSASRTAVIESGRNLTDILQTVTSELQKQINSEYDDLKSEVLQVDDILEQIVKFNNEITAQEVTGATANDLRDRRDLLVDQLSEYMNINVTENQFGAYQINSGGVTLVNGASRAHLLMSKGISSSYYGVDYGVTDYNMKIKESDIVFEPQNGILKARLDSIAEDKAYIDKMADIASFLLTAFNDQHKQGWDMDGDFKYVDSNGDRVDPTTVTNTMVDFVNRNNNSVPFANAKKVGDYYYDNRTTALTQNTDGTYSDGTTTYTAKDVVKDGTNYYLKITKVPEGTKYFDNNNAVVDKVPDTINFFGQGSLGYEYRYDALNKDNYLYSANGDRMLSGVRIIAELKVNSLFDGNRGDRYVAAATSYDVTETQDANMNITRDYAAKAWGNRTGDGTNAVYLSELFNISQETIIKDGKANSLLMGNYFLRNKDGKTIDAAGNVTTNPADYVKTTAISNLSLNSFYQKSMSTLGIDAYTVDVNFDASQSVMTQVINWRDSTAGVDWNEELSNMIIYQKAFTSCSRCLNAMDECLDRLVNSTGVVGR